MSTHLNSSVCLVSPLHDPEAKLLDMLILHGEALQKFYKGSVCVSVSDTTSPQIIASLEKLQIYYQIIHHKQGNNIASDIKNAIQLGFHFDTPYIHLVDFDRALHWVKRFPRELRDVITLLSSSSGFTSFVRTTRAFETHPYTQRSTEEVINAIATEVSGVRVDLMSGSFGFERAFAKKVVQEVQRKDFGIYAEFLQIALKHTYLVSTIEVDGLEWETPDQFQDEIRRESYGAWLKQFQSLSEWQKRVSLLQDSADVLLFAKKKL